MPVSTFPALTSNSKVNPMSDSNDEHGPSGVNGADDQPQPAAGESSSSSNGEPGALTGPLNSGKLSAGSEAERSKGCVPPDASSLHLQHERTANGRRIGQ